MDFLIENLRYTHIGCGSLLLLLGLIQLVFPKYGRRHKIIGILYFILMWVTGLTSIFISIYRIFYEGKFDAIFLLIIALFSIYMVTSGFLHAHSKDQPQTKFGKTIALFGLITGVGFMALAGRVYYLEYTGMAILCLVFGVIQLILGRQDFRYFHRIEKQGVTIRGSWVLHHLGRMIGSYIAAVTAFLLNAVHSGPGLLKWFGPSLIGFIMIRTYIKKYAKKSTL